MKSTFIMNKRVEKAAILVCLIVAFMALCLTGCEVGGTAQKREPVTLSATATEAELQEKLADGSVSGVILSGDISLTEPLQIADSKTISGAGTISAGEGFSGEYLITVSAKAELLLGGDVVVDAAGVAGGVHVASNAVLTIQDQVAVKNASAERANLFVEGYLDMLSGYMLGAQGHNIHNKGEANVVGGEIRGSGSGCAGIYNEGTLSQNGGLVTRGYNNIVSTSGSEFTWNGGSNENAVNNGIVVAPKAELNVTARDAKLTGAGNLGIELQGTAVIDDITLHKCFDTLIKVASTGKLTLNGGMFFDSAYHGVDNDGVMVMNGGDIMNCANCGIVNTGTLEVKAGGISSNANKGILNKLGGKATVVGEDITLSGNKFAIGNEDKAYFELSKAYIMGSTTTNIYALGGEMYIHDIELGASISNNIRIVAADLKLKNVTVNGNASTGSQSMHGIILEGGKVNATDLTVCNTTGAGIRNKGGSFTGKNVTLTNNKYIGIYVSDQDVTGRPSNTDITNLTVSNQGYMSISSNGTGVLEINNGVFEATPSNNIRVNGGTVKLNKVEVKGHTEEATTAHHGIYLEGGHIIANDLTITDTKGNGLRNKSGDFTGTNVIIKNVNGDSAISNVLLADGTAGTITLTNVAISNVKSKNVVCEAGTIKINSSTLSPCPGSNIKITGGAVVLDNVHVAGNQKVGTEALHAIIIEKGKGTLLAKNVTITDAKDAGIRNKTGVIEATNLTIKDCGASAVSNGADTVRGLSGITKIDGLTVENCGNNNIVAEAGKVEITNAKLGLTKSNNVKTSGDAEISLVKSEINGSTGSYGVIAEGGKINLTDVTIKDTKTAGIRVNKANGSVTGSNVTIENTGTHAIYVNHGTVVIDGLTTKNIGERNIQVGANAATNPDGTKVDASGGSVHITNGKLAKTENQHSVVAYGEGTDAVIELDNVTLNGSGNVGGSRHVILAEGGDIKLKDVTIKDASNAAIRVNKEASSIEGTNVTIKGGNWGISASAGKVTVKNLKSTAENRNIAAEGAAIVIEGAELGTTTTHNIKINKGSLTLKDATVAGSSDRGIMIEPGASDGQPTVDLTNVKISDTAASAIENRGGVVTAKDLTITDSKGNAIQNQLHKDGKTAGSVTVTNCTVSDSSRSINNDGGTVAVVGGTFGVTTGHNVKATSGDVSLTNVTIEGTKADSGIMAEGGNVQLTDVTIKNTKVSGIRVNKAASTVTAKNLTVQGAQGGAIFASAGTVNVTNYTASGNNRNIDVSGATVTVTDATLGTSTTHNIKASKGSLTLKNATVAGSSDRGIMVEPGASDGQPVVDLTNVKISNTAASAIENRGGAVTAKDLTVTGSKASAIQNQAHPDGKTVSTVKVENYICSDSARSVNNDAGTVTVVGGTFGVTTGHNVKTTSGTVSLTNVTIDGTKADSGIMAEGGDVQLTNVSIKNVKNVGIRVNKATSSVTGTDVTIDGTGDQAIWVNNGGAVELTKLTTKNIGTRNIEAGNNTYTEGGKEYKATAGTVKITDGDLCKTEKQHNVVAYGENAGTLVELTNVTVNGSGEGRHVLLAEGGNMKLTDVTIKDANNAAIRVNKAASTLEGTNVTIEGGSYGISASAGNVTIKDLKSTAENRNIAAEGATIVIDGAELGTTKTHNIKIDKGSLTLKNATVAGSSDRGIMVEPGASDGQPTVDLENVKISNTVYALDNMGGIVNAKDLTVSDSDRSINNVSGTVTVVGGTFGVTPGHNVKAGSGTVSLTDVTINGTTKDNGIMAEGGNFVLNNVTIKNAKNAAIRINKAASSVEGNGVIIEGVPYGVSGSAGTVNIKNLTSTALISNILAEGASITVDGGTLNATGKKDATTPHNVKTISGSVTLNNVTVNGVTDSSAHALMAEGGDMTLTNVIIDGAKNAALRVNKAASNVTATNLTIRNSANGVSVSAGEVEITDLTGNASARNVNVDGGTVTVNGGTLGATSNHNIMTTAGTLELTGITINGSGNYGVLCQGGTVTASNLTVKNTTGAALRTNRDNSSMTVNGLTVENCVNAIKSSAGTMEITTMTASTTGENVVAEGAAITINGATLTNGYVKHTAGTLNLQNATAGTVDSIAAGLTLNGVKAASIANSGANASMTDVKATTITNTGNGLTLLNVEAASINNSAANLSISGKIVGSITNSAAVAVNVNGALSADSAIVIDWTEGNGPVDAPAISFTAGTMAADQSKFTLGAIQSKDYKLVYEENTGILESLIEYAAKIGDTKYEHLSEAITALNKLTGDQTLIILKNVSSADPIVVPEGMNLTIQGHKNMVALDATVKVGEGEKLIIGNNVKITKVEAASGEDITYAGNSATAASPLTVVVKGNPYEVALTLAQGNGATGDMFNLVDAAGNAYGSMIDSGKVVVYTKEVSDEASMLAAVNGAPANKRGYVIVTGDVTLSNTLTFSAGKFLTVMDDGNERTISRTNAAVDMIVVETGANITIKSSDNSSRKLVLDGKSVGNNSLAMVRVTGGTATINNVNIANANKNYNLFCSAGTLNVTSAELGSNLEVSSVYVTGGKVSLTDVEVKDAGSNSIRAQGGEIALHNVTVNGHTRSATLHNINIDGGKVTATGTLTLNNSKASGIRISKGSFDGANATVTVNNMGDSAINATGGTVTIGTLNVDTTKGVAIYVNHANAVVSVTNATLKNMGSKDAISAKAGSVTVGTLSVDTAGNAVTTTGGTVTVTTGGTIKNVNRAVQVTSGTVSLTGMTIEKNLNSHNIKVENGGLNLSGVTIEGSKSRAIMVEPATKDYHPNVTLHNVIIEDADSYGLQNKGGIVTATGTLTINNTTHAIYNRAHKNTECEDPSGSVTVATLSATGNGVTVDSAIGTVTVNGGTLNSTGVNVSVTGGTVTIKNSALATTGAANVVEHKGGTLNLENVTAATIYNSVANLNISGKIVGAITNDAAVAVNVTSALTDGSAVTVDWAEGKAPADTAISFTDEAAMTASKGYFTLGASQTAANKYLVFEGTKGKLQNIPVVTTQAELEQALANVANIPVIKIAANTTVSLENVAFPTTPVTIQGQTGSVLKYAGSTQDASVVNFPANANVTFKNVTFDGNNVGKLLIPADANVTLENCTLNNMKGCKDRSLHVQGNLNLRGTVTIDGAKWGLGVNGSGVVTSETGSKLVIKNATYGVTTHDTANVHIVEIETTNVSNSALYNDGSSVMVVDNANLGATASGKYTVDVLKGTVTLSNATITKAGGNAVNQRAGSLTLSKVTITNPGGYGVIQNAGSLTMNTVTVENAPGWSVCVNGDSAVMNATNLTVSGSKGTCLQIEKGTATINNFVTTNVVSSHNIKMSAGSLTINGMNLGKSNSNNINLNGTSSLILKGTCVINGTVSNNGIVLNGSSSVQIGGDFTTKDCAGDGIYAQAGTVKLSGKVNTNIKYTAAVSLNVTGALTAGSNVTVDWANGKAPAAGATAIQFASADVLTASKGFITLGATQAATQELSFGETTATLVAKQ